MKKKILSASLAVACALSMLPNVFAEINPTVEVNNMELVFADQKPVIIEGEGRTLVPARGIFEYMGATVDWDEEKELVSIFNNGKKIEITIGNPLMKVYTFSAQNLFAAPALEEITLDAPPRLMNDRTMIPLRAISESLGAEVAWNEKECKVDILTSDYKAPVIDDTSSSDTSDTTAPVKKDIVMSLSSNTSTAKVGDEIEVTVNLKNIPEGYSINGLTLGLIYDKSKFEYISNSFNVVNKNTSNYICVDNPKFSDDSIKLAAVTTSQDDCAKNDGSYVTLKFKVLKEESGTIALSNRYKVNRGEDCSINVLNSNYKSVDYRTYIDTTPVTIN